MALNLADNWQIAKILTDNWHLEPPHPDPRVRLHEETAPANTSMWTIWRENKSSMLVVFLIWITASDSSLA